MVTAPLMMHRRRLMAALAVVSLLGGAMAQTPPGLTCGAYNGLVAGGAGMTQTSADGPGPNALWQAFVGNAARYPYIDDTTAGYAAEACEAPDGSTQAQIDACAAISLAGSDYTGGVAADRRVSCESTDPCVYITAGSRDRHPDTGWPYKALQLQLDQNQQDELTAVRDGTTVGLGSGVTVQLYVCTNYETWCGATPFLSWPSLLPRTLPLSPMWPLLCPLDLCSSPALRSLRECSAAPATGLKTTPTTTQTQRGRTISAPRLLLTSV